MLAGLLAGARHMLDFDPVSAAELTGTTPPTTAPRERAANSYTSDAEVIAFIDAQISKGWADAELTPSTKATENEWCRRLYIDLIGRIPTVAELKQFLSDAPATRRTALVDRLLNSDEYAEEYARNWTTHYTNLLIGRPPARANRRDMTNREGMQQFLRRSFLSNKPYDKMVYELVSATGSTKPGTENYNGATNFLVGKLQENATEATAKTAKFFLGLQVQCTQCHNHPFNDWKQDQFWNMNAFFRQTKAKPTRNGREIDFTLLTNENFKGEGSTPDEAEIYFELRNGTLQVAYPTFIDGTKINPSGYVAEVDRRAELGKMIIKSPMLGKALANRMWAHFLGYGFTKPVDDLGPHNPPSHPELLDRLGEEFAAHGHDLRRMMRWIVLSEPYSLSSRITTGNRKDDPGLGEKPRFSHFYSRQMQAEELYESIEVAVTGKATGADLAAREGRKADTLRQFTLTFANDEGDEATTFNGTIPQVLMLMNGEISKIATGAQKGTFLFKLARSGMRESEALDTLFLAALSRKPSSQDASMARALISTRGNNLLSGYQDVWWALLNSNEFIFVH
jgi:hypothetical protein